MSQYSASSHVKILQFGIKITGFLNLGRKRKFDQNCFVSNRSVQLKGVGAGSAGAGELPKALCHRDSPQGDHSFIKVNSISFQ